MKPHNLSTEEWCLPEDMEEGNYLMMEPACEVNEKGTRENNTENEALDPNEIIEADEVNLPYAEEDWANSVQMEVLKNMEQDLPFSLQLRQSDRTRPTEKYNPYEEVFLVDWVDLKKIVEPLVGMEEIIVSQDIDFDDDPDKEWIEDRSKPKAEFDVEQQQSYKQELANLLVLAKINECHDSGRRPREQEIHQE